MLKSILKDRKLLILLSLVIIIRLFSLNHKWVESYYTYGLYPVISRILRLLFGWVPFSIGDLFYIALSVYLVAKLLKYTFILIRKKVTRQVVISFFRKLAYIILEIYILFNLLWGLNYDRKGIAYQLGLNVKAYSVADLSALATLLQDRMNFYGTQVDSVQRLQLNKNWLLFHHAVNAYDITKDKYPFLAYKYSSVKPSMFSRIGQYMGFTGYYNPFSGEAQLKTSVPVFLKPFIVNHEIAHQLGYGKENEANFVGYLACSNSPNVNFKYSTYFELTLYALGELRGKDSTTAHRLRKLWSPRVQHDYKDFLSYLFHNENSVEPIVMRFYDQYLKLNNQPKGYKTYNEVIGWLIAYMKKYGPGAI